MDWNLKNPLQWDWEIFAPFSGKETEIAKPSQQSEWKVRDGGNVNKSVHSSGRAFSSGSEIGNGSSKSSISASADSSSKAGNKIEFNFETVKGFGKNLNKNERSTELEYAGALSSSREPLIGLKLGKRTYFEDVCGGNNAKNLPSSASGAPSTALVKRTKASHQSMQSSFCQVEGCNIDLALAKDYHRKHRVCEIHSKSSKVIVAGQERRFCQQCSRFHDLSEFDLKKRSCRRRLSDHNARRRKPQPETISFSSSRISTSIYDDRQQMNLLFSRVPFGQVRSNVSSLWEDSGGFKITQMEGSWGKSTKAGGVEGQPHFPNPDLSNNVTTLRHDLDRLLPFKGTTAEVLNQGLEASAIASNLNGAPDLRRALSLLSTDSCGPADLGSTSQLQFANANQNTAAYPAMHVNSTSGFWHDQQPLAQQARVLAFDHHGNSNQFQEFQLLKTSYENSFFDSTQIH